MASAYEIMQRMKERQAARERAFEPLAEILAKRQDLQQQMAETDEPYGLAFATAEAAGWTTDELKELVKEFGDEEPVKRPKARTTRARRTSKKEGAEAPPAESSAAPPAAAVPAQDGSGEAAPVAPVGTSG